GNDFAIDDISFGTLNPFIKLTSPNYTDDEQVICEDTPFDDITYEVGGDSNGADIQWQKDGVDISPINTLPPGIMVSFDGSEYRISGTPTEHGIFTYTIYVGGDCGLPKTASGVI